MKFIDALFCENIRYEIGNKVSLMGLYHERIVIHATDPEKIKWPLPINISTFLRFNLEETLIERESMQFIFEYLLNQKSLIKIEGSIKVNGKNEIFTIAFTGGSIPLEPGNLGFSIKIFDKNHTYLIEKKEMALKIIKG